MLSQKHEQDFNEENTVYSISTSARTANELLVFFILFLTIKKKKKKKKKVTIKATH